MSDSKQFAGRLALVTGASRGIGASTAEALAEEGAHVILVARSAPALEEVEERIHAVGGSATIAPLDLTDGESIGKLAAAVAERWQKLDILVLNAAMLGSLTPVQDIDPKEYSRLLSLNLLANQAMIAAFDPLLKNAERADIVALTSSVGSEPRAFWGPMDRPRRRSRCCSAPMPTRPSTPAESRSISSIPERLAPGCARSPSPGKSRRASNRPRPLPTTSSSGSVQTSKPARKSGSTPEPKRKHFCQVTVARLSVNAY